MASTGSHLASFGADLFLDDLHVVRVSSMHFIVHVVHVDKKDASPANKIIICAIIAPLRLHPCYAFHMLFVICAAPVIIGIIFAQQTMNS